MDWPYRSCFYIISHSLNIELIWLQGRQHVFVWIASIVAGTANDAIFMALPIVDNFWQV
jgi:hypothetical protein